MTVYCIKTADIPAEELKQWHDVGYALEDEDIKTGINKQAWINHWFNEGYLYIDTSQFMLLISTYKPPLKPYLPLTLSILKTLALLKLTGDCNDSNNSLSVLTSTED
jgi:hypothetical protein